MNNLVALWVINSRDNVYSNEDENDERHCSACTNNNLKAWSLQNDGGTETQSAPRIKVS